MGIASCSICCFDAYLIALVSVRLTRTGRRRLRSLSISRSRSLLTEFRVILERTKVLGFQLLEIEADPNAEPFYQRLGAHRIGTRIREVEQQRRELPILMVEIDRLGAGAQQNALD